MKTHIPRNGTHTLCGREHTNNYPNNPSQVPVILATLEDEATCLTCRRVDELAWREFEGPA